MVGRLDLLWGPQLFFKRRTVSFTGSVNEKYISKNIHFSWPHEFEFRTIQTWNFSSLNWLGMAERSSCGWLWISKQMAVWQPHSKKQTNLEALKIDWFSLGRCFHLFFSKKTGVAFLGEPAIKFSFSGSVSLLGEVWWHWKHLHQATGSWMWQF